MPIKHEAKPSALLASRQHTKCFILRIARARPCYNGFKELTRERLIKAYPFQSITRPSTLASQVRRFWMLSYANASVSRLILAELTWIHHLVSLFAICFSHPTVLYCNIRSTPDTFPALYGKYSIEFYFDPPMQSSLNLNVYHVDQYCQALVA